MKNRTWILIFLGAAAVLAAVWLLLPARGGAQAGIYQDGVLLYTVTPAGEARTVHIDGPAGGNTVEISQSGVRVIEAGCPDQVCVRHGYLTENGLPVVCLPNRLTIRWLSPSEQPYDAVSGAGG